MDKQKSKFSTENSILGESQWAVNVKVNNTDKTKFFWLTGKLTFMLHYRIHTSLSHEIRVIINLGSGLKFPFSILR